jgi:hypothetical protein
MDEREFQNAVPLKNLKLNITDICLLLANAVHLNRLHSLYCSTVAYKIVPSVVDRNSNLGILFRYLSQVLAAKILHGSIT